MFEGDTMSGKRTRIDLTNCPERFTHEDYGLFSASGIEWDSWITYLLEEIIK